MKELDFLKIINSSLEDNSFLGDDCAYLKEFGLFITQDTLVENIHFKMGWTTPEQLAEKSIAVNLSDLAASACLPKYLTISLSLPNTTGEDFIEKFYKSVNKTCKKYGVEVIGGDLTGSVETCISICAIGQKISKHISSRKNAKDGDLVVVTGTFGGSHAGLHMLEKEIKEPYALINKHLTPTPRIQEGLEIGENASSDFAMMDSSDGLIDALFKIATASNVCLEVDFEKIPVSEELKLKFKNYQDFVIQGGEDYELVACIDEKTFKKLDKNKFRCIGKVTTYKKNQTVAIKDKEDSFVINETNFDKFTFNHFKKTEET